jgi:hypothetical protein
MKAKIKRHKDLRIFSYIYALEHEQITSSDKLLLYSLAILKDPKHGYSQASFAELSRRCCIAVNTVKDRLSHLQELGYVRKSMDDKEHYKRWMLYNLLPDESTKDKRKAELAMMFEDFWSMYPRKTSKQAALKAYIALDPDDELAIYILKDLANRCIYQWTDPKDPYILYASTYLNQRRFEDDIEIPEANNHSEGKVLW